MKTLYIILSTALLMSISLVAQTNKEDENPLFNYDYSPIFSYKETDYIGYIGDDYQRFYFKIDEVEKLSRTLYSVKGKTKVKSNICSFEGSITVSDIIENDEIEFVDNEFVGQKVEKQGVLEGVYSFAEDHRQLGSGFFSGKLSCSWYIDEKGELHYDDLLLYSDGYCNNQFEGTWTSYKTKKSKKCNWGHYRIPDRGSLDIGAGEFSPDPAYYSVGWANYEHLFDDSPEGEAARIKEKEVWAK